MPPLQYGVGEILCLCFVLCLFYLLHCGMVVALPNVTMNGFLNFTFNFHISVHWAIY